MELDTTPRDPLSLRIFRNEPAANALPPATSLCELREELQALQKENAALRQALRLSSGLRQRFEKLFDDSPLGLISHDTDGRITEANLTLASWLQRKRAQLIGQHMGTLVAPEDHARFVQHLHQLRETDTTGPVQCTLRLVNQQQTIPVRLESTRQPAGLYNPGHDIHTRIFACINGPKNNPQCLEELAKTNAELQNEISERELAEEKTRQHQERLAHAARLNTMGEMASGLAHEINQPLTAIRSYSQSCLRLLNAGPEKQAQLPRILKQVLVQAQRASDIIQHLRDFVRKTDTHREPTNLTKTVQRAVCMMHHDIVKNDIKFDIRTQADLPRIKADSIQIEQVVINLLRNAIEAMAEMPGDTRRLRFVLDAPDKHRVRVSISDTGPGIDKDNMQKVSTPFFSTKSEGMGLGLAISRTIVEDHGGQLSHKSNKAGGTTFSFTLAVDGKQQPASLA